ncbi:MAG: hypothetical protein QOJ42_2639 [Acidobacteriaceae bacterium]|nr:hypothetical protein [Acidobacteriaceae bacterium]
MNTGNDLPAAGRIVACRTVDAVADVTVTVGERAIRSELRRLQSVAGTVQIRVGPAIEHVEKVSPHVEGEPLFQPKHLADSRLLVRGARLAKI